MRLFEELPIPVGQRFNKLLVLGRAERPTNGYRATYWLCQCDCGNIKAIPGTKIMRGEVKACGCYKRQWRKERPPTKHGHTNHGRSPSPTYHSWQNMKARCRSGVYKEKGIVVCARWANSFVAFISDMGERPEGTSLDRFPNKAGNYEPGNCRWATQSEQQRNRCVTLLLEHNGKRQTLDEWAEELGLSKYAIHGRLLRGETVEQALNTRRIPLRIHEKPIVNIVESVLAGLAC